MLYNRPAACLVSCRRNLSSLRRRSDPRPTCFCRVSKARDFHMGLPPAPTGKTMGNENARSSSVAFYNLFVQNEKAGGTFVRAPAFRPLPPAASTTRHSKRKRHFPFIHCPATLMKIFSPDSMNPIPPLCSTPLASHNRTPNFGSTSSEFLLLIPVRKIPPPFSNALFPASGVGCSISPSVAKF